MSVFYSHKNNATQRFFAGLAIVALLASALPLQVFAEEAGEVVPVLGCIDIDANNYIPEATEDDGTCTYDPDPVPGCTDDTATNYNVAATEDDGTCEYPDTETTSTTTDSGAGEGETASSTDTGTDAGDGSATGDGETGDTSTSGDAASDGADGSDNTADGASATTTATTTPETTATTTDDGSGTTGDVGDTGSTDDSGTAGGSGDGGDGGDGGAGGGDAQISAEPESDPVPVFSESELGDDDSPDDGEGITGGVAMTGRNTSVFTGNATAQGDISTYVNSNHVRSEATDATAYDLDIYNFTATGTNEAIIINEGATFSMTGDNTALSTGVSEIVTGSAVSTLNIANVVNSNVVNSDGFIYLKNQILEESGSLDLGSFFFPDEGETLALADGCSLLSCRAEDVIYNFSQSNTATVTNDGIIEAISGENVAEGDYAQIETGDAYGGANIINVVNTNIIDSNYRLLTYNAFGDLNGDVVLPTEELFQAFFGRPNGMTQLESGESAQVAVNNTNNATVEDNLDAYAETGLNESATAFDAAIHTGDADAESNILNRVNQNIYGGDSMYLLIRIHGWWSGDVVGLPDGLSWEWTPEGILIYNTGAEIAPSMILPYDVDSYTANFTNQNDVVLENNITIDAISGKNSADGLVGNIQTGDAIASANVMNIANTNIIGVNWTMAVINIFGDFDGNVTFAKTDLELGGAVESTDEPVMPGSPLTYTYVITNNSDVTATGVTLKQTLQGVHATGSANQQEVYVGTLAPGVTREVVLTAVVDPNLDSGTTSVSAVAGVNSNESDSNEDDNFSLLTVSVSHGSGSASDTGDVGTTTGDGGGDTGTTTDSGDDTGTTTDDGTGDTGTTTDDGTEESGDADTGTAAVVSSGGSSSSGGGGGGGGGGGSKSSKPKVSRATTDADAKSMPLITLLKTADTKEGEVVMAGELVDYTIVVDNKGGTAYDAIVSDTLRNPIGGVLNSQSWDLGTILPGEKITLDYTTSYNADTPSGTYTNTASIEAYRNASTTRASTTLPLIIEDSVHTLQIKGKALAVGNVGVVMFLPSTNGKSSALIAWETNTPTDGQIFFGPKKAVPQYNAALYNLGYPTATVKMPFKTTKHYMVVSNLAKGTEYSYHIRSTNAAHTTVGGPYTFTVPGTAVATLAVTPRVSGASITVPNAAPTPAPRYIPPPAPAPVKDPEPEPEPEPAPEPEPEKESGGLGGFVKKVFGFFR